MSVTMGSDGVLAASLGSQQAGTWTLLLDGDHDGFFQPWSDQLLPLTITPAPPAVTGLAVVAETPERLRFTWNPLANAPSGTHYRLEADTLPTFPWPTTLTVSPDTSYTDSLSVPSLPLRLYRVKAVTP